MSNNIFLSTTCFNKDSLEEIIKISRYNGITNLEISGGLEFINEKKLLDLFEKNIDINFRFHNYFPIPRNPFVINLASKKTSGRVLFLLAIAHLLLCSSFAPPAIHPPPLLYHISLIFIHVARRDTGAA